MTSAPGQRTPIMRFLRRTLATSIIGFIFFVVLWMTVFNAVTSALVASGGAVVIVAGSSMSETFQAIFETVAELVLGVFGAIAEFFSSIFGG